MDQNECYMWNVKAIMGTPFAQRMVFLGEKGCRRRTGGSVVI